MKHFIKDFFTYSKGEKNGIFILVLLIIVLLSAPLFLPFILTEQQVDFTAFQQEIKQFQEAAAKQDSLHAEQKQVTDAPVRNFFTEETKELVLFPFNPNGLPEAEWQKLGLSDKQIKVIKHYEAKGGKFFKKEDVKKMYVISEKQYLRMEPYIQIPEKEKSRSESSRFPVREKYSNPSLLIELNTTDSASLVKLDGIGPAFASRILKYRNQLGGFINKEQLLEVYGLQDSIYNKFSENIVIDVFEVSKLNINTATAAELNKHPYLNYGLASLIVNYRKRHGNYSDIAELKKLVLMDEDTYRKILPYITVK